MSQQKVERLNTIFGYTSNVGFVNDPTGKAGLAQALVNNYIFGTKKYPKSQELFYQLEKTGAVLGRLTGRNGTTLLVNSPKDEMKNAQTILAEIFENTLTNEGTLAKIVESQSMEIDDLESDPQGKAFDKFGQMIFGTPGGLGRKEDLMKLTVEDITKQIQKVKDSFFTLEIKSENDFTFDDKKLNFNENAKTHIAAKQTGINKLPNYEFIPSEIPQQTLIYGFRTEGFTTTDHVMYRFAKLFLAWGMVGPLSEKIREEMSAAYYVAATGENYTNKGQFCMYAGVSEENLVKALSEGIKIFEAVSSGDFDDYRIDMTKKAVSVGLMDTWDDLNSLWSFYSSLHLENLPIESFDSLIEKTNAITKDDLTEFFQKLMKCERYLVVNGKISDKTKDQALTVLNIKS